MIDEIVKHISGDLSKEDIALLEKLEGKEIYDDATNYAFEFLMDLGFWDCDFCKKYNFDYVNITCPNNRAKIMVAYIKMKEEKLYEIHRKIHRKIPIR